MEATTKIDSMKQLKVAPWFEDRFRDIESQVREFLKLSGFVSDEPIHIIPASSHEGDNLTERSDRMLWYKGPCLMDSLNMAKPQRRVKQKSLRIPIQNVVKIKDVGSVAIGRIQKGNIPLGTRLYFAPGHLTGEVISIKEGPTESDEGFAGEYIGFRLKDEVTDLVRKGYVASNAEDDPAKPVRSFTSQTIILNYPGQIKVGYTGLVHIHNIQVPCTVVEIKTKLDRKTMQKLEDNPPFVRKNDACIIKWRPFKHICIEQFHICPALGRFIVRDNNQTIAFGIVSEVDSYEVIDPPVPEPDDEADMEAALEAQAEAVRLTETE